MSNKKVYVYFFYNRKAKLGMESEGVKSQMAKQVRPNMQLVLLRGLQQKYSPCMAGIRQPSFVQLLDNGLDPIEIQSAMVRRGFLIWATHLRAEAKIQSGRKEASLNLNM